MSNWDLEGLRVSGKYVGKIAVSGRVILSRVKYGGEVIHHVQLDVPQVIYGRVRERAILSHKEVTHVYSNLDELI